MLKKTKNILLIACAVLGVFGYFKIFMFSNFGIRQIYADNEIVTLLVPPERPNPVELYGQYNFNFSLSTRLPPNYRIDVEVVNDNSMHCGLVPDTADPLVWHGLCDTLELNDMNSGNAPRSLQFFSIDSTNNQRHELNRDSNRPAIFQSYYIQNTFVILPADNTTVSGQTLLEAHLRGDVSGVSFLLISQSDDTNRHTYEASKVSGTPGSSIWNISWDSLSVPNGDYTIELSFITLAGTQRSRIASSTIHVNNEAKGNICIPNWICSDWSDCSTAGLQTRTCSDNNHCGSNDGRPVERQACQYVPPGNSNRNVNIPPENTNRNVNVPPGNSNTNTVPPNQQILAPNINSPTSGAQLHLVKPVINGTADAGVALSIYLNNVLNGQTTTDASGRFSYQIAEPLGAGGYQVFAVATRGSRTSQESAHIPFTVLPPQVNMLLPQEGSTIAGGVTLSAELTQGEIDGLDFYYKAEGDNNREILVGSGRPLSSNPAIWERAWDTSSIDNGPYLVFARVYYGPDSNYRFLSGNRINININHQADRTEAPATPADNTIDTDQDGVPDYLELQLGLDPNNPDTNGNGIPDGQEVSTGLLNVPSDKLKAAQSELSKNFFEEPTDAGLLVPEKLKIVKIDNISPQIGINNLVISGIAPPDSTVTLFIYSNPIVVTTKTDASGNFTYTLDKNLEDGEHQVYVTITDETGKIVEKSSPLSFFIRRAQAVSEADYFRGDVNVKSESVSLVNNYLIVTVIIIVVVLLILLTAFYLNRKQAKKS